MANSILCPHNARMPRLRADVQVTSRPGGADICDSATGLRLAVDFEGNSAELLGATDADISVEPWRTLSSFGLIEEHLSLEQIRERQRAARRALTQGSRVSRLHELLAFACEKVPYYRDRAARYDPAQILREEDVRLLPLMGKRDLRANF